MDIKQFYHDYVAQVVNQPWFFWLLAAIGLFFILFIIASLFRHKGVKVYRDESGRSMITRKALRDLVSIACGKLDTPTRPKIEILPRRGRFDLTIRVKLYEGQKLNVLRDHVRRNVIHTFEEVHGIRLGDINVLVTGFKHGGKNPIQVEPIEDAADAPATLPTTPAAVSAGAEMAQERAEPLPAGEADDDEGTDEKASAKKRSFFAFGKKSPAAHDAELSSDEVVASSPEQATPEKEEGGLLPSESDKK